MKSMSPSGNHASHQDTNTIELALVLSGTVSAGAYSAGVMDVLLRALRRYNELPGAPHRVQIKAMAGSSGGALTLFLASLWAYQTQWAPLSHLSRNPLYHYWVERIDAALLLGLEDLQHPVSTSPLSLLNSQALTQLTQNALKRYCPKANVQQPKWLHPDCQLSITSTAFTGIPYSIGTLSTPYFGNVHQSYLNPGLTIQDWSHIRACAQASAAFPLAFSPQRISQPKQDTVTLIPGLSPDAHWLHSPPAEYEAWHVDGGVVNNSPVEFARQYLADSPTACNPRFADQANRITLLISPFTQSPNQLGAGDLSLTLVSPFHQLASQAGRLIQVMLGQSRFKWDELRLACDPDTYSRFLISPAADTQLYSHMLGAFGGFLSQAFRHHDYVIGQRDAQAFCRDVLTLPESNAIFSGWSQDDKQQWGLFQRSYEHSSGQTRTERFLPVIPLLGRELNTPIPLPNRLSALRSVDRDSLNRAMDARLKALLKRLMPGYFTGIQRITWGLIQPIILSSLMQWLDTRITDALQAMDA